MYKGREGKRKEGKVFLCIDREVGRGFNGAWSVCDRRGRMNGSREGAKKGRGARLNCQEERVGERKEKVRNKRRRKKEDLVQ